MPCWHMHMPKSKCCRQAMHQVSQSLQAGCHQKMRHASPEGEAWETLVCGAEAEDASSVPQKLKHMLIRLDELGKTLLLMGVVLLAPCSNMSAHNFLVGVWSHWEHSSTVDLAEQSHIKACCSEFQAVILSPAIAARLPWSISSTRLCQARLYLEANDAPVLGDWSLMRTEGHWIVAVPLLEWGVNAQVGPPLLGAVHAHHRVSTQANR